MNRMLMVVADRVDTPRIDKCGVEMSGAVCILTTASIKMLCANRHCDNRARCDDGAR